MSALDLLAPAGAALALAMVVAYLAYTLGDVGWLAPALLAPRRAAFAVAVGLALSGLALRPTWMATMSTLVTIVALGYAWRRQWLLPRPGPRAAPRAAPPDDTEVLIVPGGRALPLGWVRRNRLVFCGDLVIVQCGIARSLAVFTAPEGAAPLRHVLPHPTGFFVGNGEGTWDGVDGRPRREGGRALDRRPARVTTWARFQAESPSAQLFGPEGGALPASPAVQRPRVPGARGIEDATAWGVVDEAGWHPIGEGDLDPSSPGDPARYPPHYLSRWAARRRRIGGA